MKLQIGGNGAPNGQLAVGKSASGAAAHHYHQHEQDNYGGGSPPDDKGQAASSAPQSSNNVAVLGVQRGPIKATRQALIKKEDSQKSLGGNGGANSKLAALQKGGVPSQAADAQAIGLYIDSRKPKRPLGSENYQLEAPNVDMNEFMNNYQLPPKNSADTQYRNP